MRANHRVDVPTSQVMLRCLIPALALVFGLGRSWLAAATPIEPFQPDEQTLLLYHFDDGQGLVADDASSHGDDGEVHGAEWTEGRFGGALHFDGVDDCVFRKATKAIEGLKQLTVECWFKQENPEGRQFLLGKDVTFHFDFSEGLGTSLSLYHRGGAEANADGLRHQQLGIGLGAVSYGRWHHLAATFDGQYVSFFLDGVLRGRQAGARDFLLGVDSRGTWVGCYVGQDFWFHGKIDEVRVSDCVRYDPEGRLQVGQAAFEFPARPQKSRAVRVPQQTGRAELRLTMKKRYGDNAKGWVAMKAPGQAAVVVGQFDLAGVADGDETQFTCDVSDELGGDGCYIVGLEETGAGGYFAVTKASLVAGDETLATWSGSTVSRHTFSPMVLVPLRVHEPPATAASRILLVPGGVDRWTGNLEFGNDSRDDLPCLFGEGLAEFWVHVPVEQTYRVKLCYAAPVARPCDLVIDGVDLHPFHMAARNRTGGATPRNAFWEDQGAVNLAAGLHWIRLEGALPEIVALRLEPIVASVPPPIPWQRFPVPAADFLAQTGESWLAESRLGQPQETSMTVSGTSGQRELHLSTTFANTNVGELFAGDAVRLWRRGTWDLEPFGRLRFGLRGQATGHVVSLWAVDLKGDEKLLWRQRDNGAETQDIVVPISFEGNDVFDPGHVTALCLELDEGQVRAAQQNAFSAVLIEPVFERRDVIVPPEDYTAMLDLARQSLAALKTDDAPRAEPLVAPRFQPWTRPVVPEQHPRYASTEPKPVTRATLGDTLHCTGARSIDPTTLDQFHRIYDFGDVCWPHIGICPQRRNFANEADYGEALVRMEQQLEDVRRRGLYVFDIWGYVPRDANYPDRIAPEHREILSRLMQDRFLGFDNGEQDGRYIGGYASAGLHTNRREGWEDFVRWDEEVCRDSQNYMNATGSLNFSHYYGERNCRTLGLETAQGLPSDTLMFAFLRGAGKEYGRLLTQATSVWNRFGYNVYSGRRTEGAGGYGSGPNKGCSLSLHRRLFLTSYLGGHSIVGTETSQFTADQDAEGRPELSPLGRQHLELNAWFKEHPDRGVMYTPVALMLDFHHGWNMPRHLYRGDLYKIWGKFPYEKGDYLIDGLFRMIWPGYEDCSYLRNERGFLTPTPYGDIFDVITNRCHPEILQQYTAIMMLGDVEMTPEVVQRLNDFVAEGGDLLLDATLARALPDAVSGLQFGDVAKGCLSRSLVTGETFQEQPYTYTRANLSGATTLLANEHGHPLLTVNRVARGRVVVCTADRWMTDPLEYRVPEIVHMTPPYRLLSGVQSLLTGYFGSFNPVTVEPPGLGVTVCCYADDPHRLLVGLMNHDLFADWQGKLHVRLAPITAVRDILHQCEIPVQHPLPLTIPAGDAAILDIRF